MVMLASDVDKFIVDPQVRTALTKSVAALASVPVSYVANVSIRQPQQVDSNGGSAGGARRLQNSPVQVDYTIAMPKMAAAGAAAEGARIRDALGRAEPGAVTNLLVTSMGMATYNFSVTQMMQPVLRVINVATSIPVTSASSTIGLVGGRSTLVPLPTMQVVKDNEAADADWTKISLVTGGLVVSACVVCAVVRVPLRRYQQAQRMAATEAHSNNVVVLEL